jgi:cysteine desulfurase/selenocysteine lyase
MLDINKIRADFPILSQSKRKPLVYFDNGATTQKPQVVIDAISNTIKNQTNTHSIR